MTFIFFKTERYFQKLIGDAFRARRKQRTRRLMLTSLICAFLVLAVLALTFSGIGVVSRVEARISRQTACDISSIPGEVRSDARTIADLRYTDKSKAEAYYSQSLIAYNESRDKDVILLFNPGGWGTKTVSASYGWSSIVDGILHDVSAAGYRISMLNYLRTVNNLQGQLNELKEMTGHYENKAEDLASLVNFLTRHNPGLKVILAGESTGTIICDDAMVLLDDNPRVFSIQTGSPFWHTHRTQTRTILLKSNGIVEDSFSSGDLGLILKSSFKALIELDKPEMEGDILGFLAAPGHEYRWQYPGVCEPIGAFLSNDCMLEAIQLTKY
ncbi:MAG: hypothetical protein JXA46_16735 [Dehalococcoidales bacterium]|nr:hypothetical protein [Dehalococcoidales bacterium]